MLRRAIISGELESGTHLVESMLSERFQVSRAPIREALRELESEGLVESRRRGVYVKALTKQDVWELYDLRVMLEGAAAELAVSRFDEDDIAALRGHLGTMAAAAAAGETSDFAKADMGFHTELFERVGHRRLLRVCSRFDQAVWNPFIAIEVNNRHPALHRRFWCRHGRCSGTAGVRRGMGRRRPCKRSRRMADRSGRGQP